MTRRGPQQLIKWPSPGRRYRDTGEGGAWTYLLYPARHDTPPLDAGLTLVTDPEATVVDAVWPDPMARCHSVDTTLALPLPDVVIRDWGRIYPDDDELPPYAGPLDPAPARMAYLEATYNAGSAILGGLLLGSSRHALVDAAGTYWAPTRDDLTRPGRRLLRQLDRYFRRPGWLVTYLDT